MASPGTSLQDLSVPLNSNVDAKLAGSRSFLLEDSPSPEFTSSKIFRSQTLRPQKVRTGCFIPHDHKLKQIWNVGISLLITFSSIESLLYISYHDHGFAMNNVDPAVWCLFVIDLGLNFLTDYIDEDGQLVRSYKGIARRYVKSWFCVDAIALTPLMFFGHAKWEHYCQLLRILKINRFFSLIDEAWILPLVISCFGIDSSSRAVHAKTVIRFGVMIVKQLLVIIAFTFFTGAAYYWFASLMSERVFDTGFVSDYGPNDLDRPLESWYFAVTTLSSIGYGDLVPPADSAPDRIFVIIMAIAGIGIFTVIIGQYNSLINEVNAWRHNTNAVSELEQWMLQCDLWVKRIPERMKLRILDFYQSYWKLDRLGTIAARWWTCRTIEDFTTSPDPVFSLLPVDEQEQILTLLFGDLFYHYADFFLPGRLRFDLALHLSPRLFEPQEVILKEGELPREAILVTRGLVYCGRGARSNFVSVVSYANRVIIGDIQILMKKPSIATYKVGDARPVAAFSLPSKALRKIVVGKHSSQLNVLLANGFKYLNVVKQAFQSSAAVSSMHIEASEDTQEREMIPALQNLCEIRFPDTAAPQSKAALEELRERLARLKAEKRRRRQQYWTDRGLILTAISQRVSVLGRT